MSNQTYTPDQIEVLEVLAEVQYKLMEQHIDEQAESEMYFSAYENGYNFF